MSLPLEERVAIGALISFFAIGLVLIQFEPPRLGLFREWIRLPATDIRLISVPLVQTS